MSNQLQQDLRKRTPFDSLEEEVNLNLLRTGDQFQNRFGRLFREFGLTPSQYNVLRILRGEGKPLPCQDIAARMLQVVPAMTGLIDRLEQQQLVQRVRSSTDRRVIFVELTAQGLKLIGQLDVPLRTLQRELIGHLTRTELKELNRLLEKCRQSLLPDEE